MTKLYGGSSMSQMRACVACGKMFMPKGRERYCPGPHYLPCPVCGKPVEIEYISYGPHNCDECKGKRAPKKPAAPKMQSPTAHTSLLQSLIVNDSKEKDRSSNSVLPSSELIEDGPATKPDSYDNAEVEVTEKKELSFDTTGMDVRTYIGTLRAEDKGKRCFIPGHDYVVDIDPPSHTKGYYVYEVTAIYDATDDKGVDLYRTFASMKSLEQNFVPVPSI